jgi:hypothetical protein
MGSSLVAFDTDHIKRYVFGTNKLKEIRGASSLLDYLNRVVMVEFAESYHAQKVYAHGGSGLFLVPTEHLGTFSQQVQQAYQDLTGGGASVTCVDVPLPEHVNDIGSDDIANTLELLQWRLQEEKAYAPTFLALPSHPFLRPCDSCGVEYVDGSKEDEDVKHDPGEENERYCKKCQNKRIRDTNVKKIIEEIEAVQGKRKTYEEHLWDQIIFRLREMDYHLPPLTERPKDFNVFRNFKGSKDYLALVYADANGMGRAIEDYHNLESRQRFAHTIDKAIYEAVCTAITRHLQINDHLKAANERSEDLQHPVFPFDILLMGGDDICMVVPASVALDVALTLAETFHQETEEACKQDKLLKPHTLSVGVVLAPIKYPFGLLREMAETTLTFAKKKGSDARAAQKNKEVLVDDTRINFMVVTGSSSADFKHVYNKTYHKKDDDTHQEFHATLRPYAPEDLHRLLSAIRERADSNRGRTKLHQIREAILKMNLTTSVGEGLAVLRNWREKQRDHVVHNVYEFAGRHQMPRNNPADPVSGFPQVTFPWFKDGTKTYKETEYAIYRTPLLDFIEIYDFLSRDGGANAEEN